MSFAAADVQLDAQLYTMIELEGGRYRAFFAKLSDGAFVSRDAALTFFRKSSLSEQQVQELYARLKALQLLRDPNRMNETEFVMGMHFIVCLTKRNLVQIPPIFPSYLFPTLDLTPDLTPERPEPLNDLNTQQRSDFNDPQITSSVTPLGSAQSLRELVSMELRSKQQEAEGLSRVDQSAARALQSLHACVERIADQVDALGFPVPSSSRSLDALDDPRNLLQKHVHAAKQEIQSMQINAQMRSVTSESTPREDPLKVASGLTQELLALQQQTAQLMAKKADVVGRIIAVKSGGSAAGSMSQRSSFAESKNPAFALSKGALTVGELGTVSASTTPPKHAETNVNPSLMHSHNSASSGGWGTFGAATAQDPSPPLPFAAKTEDPPASSDPFSFAPAPQQSESAPTLDKDLAWGAFQ
ncbi:hypothetical protein PRIC1_011118 [Phytophthora ramorum]